MRIVSVHIHNFRSISDATMCLGDYSLAIGPNNSGKSNFIDAIRVFYDDPKFDCNSDTPKFRCDDEECWIEVEFALTDDEHAELADTYQRADKRLRVRKVLQSSDGRKPGIYGYTGDSVLSDDLFYGTKNVQQGKFGHIIYIPAVSKLDEHTKLSGPSALRDLLQEVMSHVLASSESYGALVRQFGTFAQEVKNEATEDNRSLMSIENDINAQLGDWGVRLDFRVDAVSEEDLLKRLLSFEVRDEILQVGLHPERYGHGLQRHLIFTLIRLAASQPQAIPAKSKKEFSPNLTLILFEEPEAFLHPTQQLTLYRSLQEISQQADYQVLISSHSPYFVSFNVDDIPSIIRLRRDKKSGKTLVGQIGRTELNRILTDNRQINMILNKSRDKEHWLEKEELDTSMEALRYFLWLDPERCGLFFADHVLLIEGSTERVLFNYLLKTGQLNGLEKGLFVLDCLGKFNMHRFMNLLEYMHIPHSVICDNDGGWVHQEINKLILKSKNMYTVGVEFLNPDLEGQLGIAKPAHSRRKPESLMLKLSKGQIPKQKLAQLMEMVKSVCTEESQK